MECGDIIVYGSERWVVFQFQTTEDVKIFRAIGYGRDEMMEDRVDKYFSVCNPNEPRVKFWNTIEEEDENVQDS